MAYSINCDFDIEKHKQTYINYLEVLITEDGEIIYAVPSHQEKAEELCCKKLGISKEKLVCMCPEEYYFNYLSWLLTICGAISVWNNFYEAGTKGINKKQKAKLKLLKLNGLYKGSVT